MRSLRRSVLIGAVSGAVLLAAACGSGDSKQGDGPADDPGQSENVTLNVWGWSGSPGAENMQKLVEAFETDHPGVTVEYNEIVNTDYANQATLALSSDQKIDVLAVFPNEWAIDNEGYLLPVADWPGVDGILDNIQDQAIEQTERLFSDGVLRSVPLYAGGAPVAYYNKDILDELGIDEAPATWDDMRSLAGALEESEHGAITALIPSDHWFQSDIVLTLVGQREPSFWNNLVYDDGPWDTPATRDGLTAYRDAFATGALDKATLDVQNADAKMLFGQGESVMFVSGTWDAGLLTEEYRAENDIDISDIGVVPFPGDGIGSQQGIRSFIDSTFGIPENSEHKELAAQFIEYIAVGPGVDIWAESLVGIPVVENWELQDGILSSDTAIEAYALIQELVANPQSDRYTLSNFENQQASYALQVASGDLSPEEAAEMGQRDLESGKYN